jgi:serine phosphatase RsbU (regulator of sigma subunit)
VDALSSPAAIDAITRLAPESAVLLPLTARCHLVGVLSLCRGAARSPMPDQEIQAAIGIAERAGLALDNIRLYAEQRSTSQQLREANYRLQLVAAHDRTVARALQDAMLTRLPEPDHLHLVARYLTATGTERVGGDWYDAVVLPTGTTTLMIGDVAGHDIAAAAVMGQLRNMLRAFAWDRGDDTPSASVTRLDRAMRELRLGTLATLAVVQIEQHAADDEQGLRTIRWTNAGHPPPVLVHPDGSAVVLDAGQNSPPHQWPGLAGATRTPTGC